MDGQKVRGYLLSLPERTLRSLSAIAGGAAQEVGAVVLPARVRRSRLYDSLVASSIRFLVENLGQVERKNRADAVLPADFLLRRSAGNVVEIAGFVAFRASPVWVLAALADVAGASRDLIKEITAALQDEGLLEKDRTFENVDQLLDGLERTSGRMAEAVNTPPLNVAGLREEWEKLRSEAPRLPRTALPSPERLWSQWRALHQEAREQGRSVVELSSVMALAAVRRLPENTRWLSSAVRTGGQRTGQVVARGLLDHYRTTLAEIHEAGYVHYWFREFQPYLIGALGQFSPERVSSTERFLTRRPAPGPRQDG